MRKFALILIVCLSAAFSPLASARTAGARMVTDSLYSSILGTQVKFNVYLPENYDPAVHFPVIYLLHGLSDTYTAWKDKGNMKIVTDELVTSGECVPCVIVMPNAGGPNTAEEWNGYFNMPGWNYEDFFFGEFIPSVEQRYNAGGRKGLRAVMGLSMGGGGSVVYCQKHPEMFSSCYAMSPWLDDKGDRVRKNHKEDKHDLVCRAVCENSALDFIANADEATLEALRTVKWFVDCGDDDFLLDTSVKFHQIMRDKGVRDELRVRNGKHNWEYWHLALRWSLPFASRNFE